MKPERQMPSHCPSCKSLLATTGEPHCKDKPACPWLRCSHCKAVVDAAGRWFRREETGAWSNRYGSSTP